MSLFNDSLKFFFFFFGGNVLLLLVSGLLIRFGYGIFDHTADKVGGLGIGFLGVWIDNTVITVALHNILYGSSISLDVQLNSFASISPSSSPYVCIGTGSSISSSSISGKYSQKTVIGNNVTVGWRAKIKKGTMIGDGAAIASLAVVHENSQITTESSFFNENLSTSSSSKRLNPNRISYFTLVYVLLVKFFFIALPLLFSFSVTIWCVYVYTFRSISRIEFSFKGFTLDCASLIV
jgi:acetyltransferase-like isoleucine patch superfamily enzyme